MKRLLLLAAIGLCVLVGGEQAQPARAQVLLPYGTNVARVVQLELNYVPDQSQLQVAVTTDARFVKRAEYRNDAAIQNVLQVVRFKERGKLFIVYEENRILGFFVQE
jgi:uncharacterized protein YggE